jgi:thermolysin
MLKSTSGKSKIGIIIATIIVFAVIAIGWFVVVPFMQSHNAEKNIEQEDATYIAYDGVYTDSPVTDAQSAIESLNALSGEFGFDNAVDAFASAGENAIDSRTYYRTKQIYNGVEVYGRSMVVVAGNDGILQGVSGNYINISNVTMTPKVTEQEAMESATKYLVKEWGCEDDSVSSTVQGLVIYTIDMDPILAYEIKAEGYSDVYVSMSVFVDAESGNVADSMSEICSVFEKATGQDGSEYDIPYEDENGKKLMIDRNRNIRTYSNQYRDFENISSAKPIAASDNNKSAIDAMGNIAHAYDFFNNTLSRKQFDNRGGELPIYVNVLGENNAYFSYDTDTGKGKMSFVVSKKGAKEYSRNLDVVAHEFTHGVTNTVVAPEGLLYRNQSGAINEAVSDIFGEIVEHQVTGHCDWRNVVRNYTEKKTMKDYEYLPATKAKDYGGVHINSRIIDYVAYQIGTDFLGTESTPKNRIVEYAKLWYGTEHMIPSNCTINEFGTAAVRMAEYMMSDGLLSDVDVEHIKAAFAEAEIITNLNSRRIEPPQYDETDDTNIPDADEIPKPEPEPEPAPAPAPEDNTNTFSIIGTWQTGNGDRAIFYDDGTMLMKMGLGFPAEEVTYYFEGTSEDGVYYPIELEGSTFLGLFQLIYGVTNDDGFYRIRVDGQNNIVLQYVYKINSEDKYNSCDLPLERVD